MIRGNQHLVLKFVCELDVSMQRADNGMCERTETARINLIDYRVCVRGHIARISSR